ncbi:MAG: hypothetical protein WCV41_02475 [Patescibacteria group bacterium]
MFDNQSPQLNNQPNPVPSKEPEDIFAATDSQAAGSFNAAPKPPQFQPKAAITQSVGNEPMAGNIAMAEPVAVKQDRKYIFIGLAAIIILVVVLIGMIALAYYKANSGKNTAATDQTGASNPSAVIDENSAAIPQAAEENAATTTPAEEEQQGQMILDEITDTDGDGLTDGEEKRLGADPNNSDTDGDGLFDREEVRIYKTNPLITDTDGDGYTDGAEVKNGYNPAGAGKLYELPQ